MSASDPVAGGTGIVYLVGAGPGDPGLMTLRSLELIVAADVIVHDRLIPAEALAPAREEAELLYVGKEPGDASVAQDQIEQLLIERARQGKIVVRLKGGDPFVFGRGGEEAESLAQAGVPFEVVPGITAGVAAPAYAGIPVTHRADASAVAFVTGHMDPEKAADGEAAFDYAGLARFPGTLVFYMGVKALPRIAERLIAEGRDPAEPAAAIERGTLPGQRTVTGPLAEIAEVLGHKTLAMVKRYSHLTDKHVSAVVERMNANRTCVDGTAMTSSAAAKRVSPSFATTMGAALCAR